MRAALSQEPHRVELRAAVAQQITRSNQAITFSNRLQLPLTLRHNTMLGLEILIAKKKNNNQRWRALVALKRYRMQRTPTKYPSGKPRLLVANESAVPVRASCYPKYKTGALPFWYLIRYAGKKPTR